ncbi:Uncharacterized protein HZ326_15258 [Fusarium oxysporum f. sp. albedinis]|nr:Uncharacterized protein HZ326_15258 [Fusarium oxysporum f. sp. albedinis]
MPSYGPTILSFGDTCGLLSFHREGEQRRTHIPRYSSHLMIAQMRSERRQGVAIHVAMSVTSGCLAKVSSAQMRKIGRSLDPFVGHRYFDTVNIVISRCFMSLASDGRRHLPSALPVRGLPFHSMLKPTWISPTELGQPFSLRKAGSPRSPTHTLFLLPLAESRSYPMSAGVSSSISIFTTRSGLSQRSHRRHLLQCSRATQTSPRASARLTSWP